MRHWLNRRVIELSYHYRLCITEKEFKAELKRLKQNEFPYLSSPQANATCHYLEKKKVILVCLGDVKGRKLEEIYGVLIHEAVHIWQIHCEYIGEEKAGVEMEAYAIQSIAQELIASYNEQAKVKVVKL